MNLKHWFGRLLAFLFLFQLFLLFFHPLGTECQPVPDGRSCWTFFPAIRTYLFNMLFAVGAGQVTFWPGICHSFMQALYPSLVLSLFQTFITHCSILMYLFNLIFIVFFPIPYSPLLFPPASNHHTVVHVHESFFLFAQSFHCFASPYPLPHPLPGLELLCVVW